MKTDTIEDLARSDIFDSRDVIARIGDLESTVTQWEADEDDLTLPCIVCREPYGDHVTEPDGDVALIFCPTSDEDERRELEQLREFEKYASSEIPDWPYGETFIAESYFEEYAQQLAEDITSYDSRNETWPFTYIDWTAAAEALQQDYTEVELLGYTFWARA